MRLLRGAAGVVTSSERAVSPAAMEEAGEPSREESVGSGSTQETFPAASSPPGVGAVPTASEEPPAAAEKTEGEAAEPDGGSEPKADCQAAEQVNSQEGLELVSTETEDSTLQTSAAKKIKIEIKEKKEKKQKVDEDEIQKMQILVSSFSEEQLNRYEMYRRSAFPKAAIKRVRFCKYSVHRGTYEVKETACWSSPLLGLLCLRMWLLPCLGFPKSSLGRW
nr:transcription initiation factor TFIID subunit 11 isoform X3 [Chrysemys picta bellii]